MSELIVDLFVSLDGFAGGEDFGPFFGYGGPDLDAWIQRHLDEPQLIVFGRRTYELLASMSANRSGRMAELPKLVVSSTLEEAPAWDNARVVRREDLGAEKEASATPLRTMGSLTLVKSLLADGLVDRLRLTVFPLVAGPRGSEPFFEGWPTERLELASTEVLDGRVVALEYVTSVAAGSAGGSGPMATA